MSNRTVTGESAPSAWEYTAGQVAAIEAAGTTATVQHESGPGREAWWQLAVQCFPPYAQYARRAGQIMPLLVLEPASDEA